MVTHTPTHTTPPKPACVWLPCYPLSRHMLCFVHRRRHRLNLKPGLTEQWVVNNNNISKKSFGKPLQCKKKEKKGGEKDQG